MRDYNQILCAPRSDFQGIYRIKSVAIDRFIRDRTVTMIEKRVFQGVGFSLATLIL